MLRAKKYKNSDIEVLYFNRAQSVNTSHTLYNTQCRAFLFQANNNKYNKHPLNKSKFHWGNTKRATSVNYAMKNTASGFSTKRILNSRIKSSNTSPINKRHMSAYTLMENAEIKRKILQYESLITHKKGKNMGSDTSYEQLEERFGNFANKIDILLSKQSKIESINPNEYYKTELKPARTKYYKIKSKQKSIPLRMQLFISKGKNTGKVFFSQNVSKPSNNNCDKVLHFTGNHMIILYSTNKDKSFSSEFIYIAMEGDCVLKFQCNFGKAEIKHKKTKEQSKVNEDSFEDIPEEILRKTYLSTSNNWIKKSIKQENYKIKKKRMTILKEEIERKEVQRKFLIGRHKEIKKIYKDILAKFVKRVQDHKIRTRTWISLIIFLKTSKYLLHCYYV